MWETRLAVEPPYDFERVLDRLSLDPLNHVNLEENYVKVPLRLNGEPVPVKVQGIGTKEKPEFLIEGNSHQEQALKRITEIFQWEIPLREVQTHFETTILKGIFAEHEGTPLILEFGPYNCLMKCIIHQQLNLAFAHTLTERFVKSFGEEVDGVWFYPLPEKVASLEYDQLRELQFSGRKAEYTIDTSRLIANGTLDLERLNGLTDDEIIKALVKTRGIGPWTAQNYLMFGLGRPNLFPKADIGIQNAIKKLLEMEQKPTGEQMDELSQEWSPYLSYASLYLWRSIEKKSGVVN